VKHRKKVIVVGGGVAGMSATQELAERGFDVVVYERQPEIPGGKARSIPVKGSGTHGRADLPGEHGFRFFPGFYRHVPDTMKRIPYRDGKNCFDNIVPVSREMMADAPYPPAFTLGRFPHTWADFKLLTEMPEEFKRLGISTEDYMFFMERMWQIMTSCRERRVEEYGRIGWFDFVEGSTRSPAYQTFFAIGLTRMLVASKAEIADTMTCGDIMAQFLFQMADPRDHYDRLLNGPTSEVWIDPWYRYLTKELGVDYRFGCLLDAFECDGRTITGVRIRRDDQVFTDTADYYLAAVPVEVMGRHLTPPMLKADPVLEGILTLQHHIKWMTGIQFYLKEDVPMVEGHQMYMASPWALTAVSQAQFWKDTVDWSKHGDGTVRGVLSVDISNWEAPGNGDGPSGGLAAKDCTTEQIARETWDQLKRGANVGRELLADDNLHSWFLDPDITNPALNPHEHVNAEPLLVNLKDTWGLRPDAHTKIPNLFLASDYVRTHTSLATMEAANEAARRAVNCILEDAGSSEGPAHVWPLHEPDLLAPLRLYDKHRYEHGLPWNLEPVEPTSWLHDLRRAISSLLDR
jgi:uncharacterized protein with NAD-binding domain and iron-sulfur cluster